jgi:hypothetical protein
MNAALSALVDDFAIAATACPDCHLPRGMRCCGPVCPGRRAAALDAYVNTVDASSGAGGQAILVAAEETTTGVTPTAGIAPRVQAWSCRACTTQWAITTVNPQPYLDRLTATVEQLGATRSVVRQVIALGDDAATLPDTELRDRLLALADRARLAQRPLVLTGQDPGGVTLSPLKPRPAAGLSE